MTEQTSRALMLEAYEYYKVDGNYQRVYPLFPDMKQPSVRRKIQTFEQRLLQEADPTYRPPVPPMLINNKLNWMDTIEDEEQEYRKAIENYKHLRDKYILSRSGSIDFDYGTVMLWFMADAHLGAPGTDYERLVEEIEMVHATPNAYIVTVGDLIDNMIIGKLLAIQMDVPYTVEVQWALVRKILRMISPRLVAAVSGNHDNWTKMLSGIDYFKEIHMQLAQNNILMDRHELLFTVNVGETAVPFKVRHRWKDLSQYNPTHQIEKDAKFNHDDWLVGVGAHTHTGSYVREFNRDGKTGLAIQLGTYKRIDEFAQERNFVKPNDAISAAVIIDDEGNLWGTSCITAACKYMKAIYNAVQS